MADEPAEQVYPPIFPPGLVQIELAELAKWFADPRFSTPLRERLVDQLRVFVGRLRELGVRGELWIDGSFATRKPDPKDVDAVLMTTEAALADMSSPNLAQLDELSSSTGRTYVRTRWQVDFYVANAESADRRRYFEALFSAGEKGIPFLEL